MKTVLLWLCLTLPGLAQSALYVNFTQSRVEGGAPLEGMVASNAPAPPEGLMVELAAEPSVSLPERVFIEPGRKATRFPIQTQAVGRNQSVRVLARVGSVTGANTLHLTPIGEALARQKPPSQSQGQPAYGYRYDYEYDYGYGYNYGPGPNSFPSGPGCPTLGPGCPRPTVPAGVIDHQVCPPIRMDSQGFPVNNSILR